MLTQITHLLVLLLLPFSLLAENNDHIKQLEQIYASIQNKSLQLLPDQAIHIQSSVNKDRLHADVYAVKNIAFEQLVKKINRPKQWCRFITLHLNIKACVYRLEPEAGLSFYAGRKFYEPAENAFELSYRFTVKTKTENYFELLLSANEGPFSTRDYQIKLEVLKTGDDVLLHMSLSYLSSFTSRLGTSVYLSTIGSDKVGFSQQKSADGGVKFIQGVEGIIERNVMRYFLALSVYLENGDQQQMVERWFDATEQYARQLNEVEKKDYLQAKHQEYQQQAEMQQRVNQKLPALKSVDDE